MAKPSDHHIDRRFFLGAAIVGVTLLGCPLEFYDVPGCRIDGSTCDDNNVCTEDRCDFETGACVFAPIPTGSDCGDGNACNGLETCTVDAVCERQEPMSIDDMDPCTIDGCEPATGIITHEPIADCGVSFWTPLATTDAPIARVRHTAVWTGSEMIIWGGRSGPAQPVGDGARYDPDNDTWTPVSMVGAPSARHSHSAVWTGSEMIVWGGFGAADYETDGARYDPTTDVWTPMSATDAPSGRTFQSAVWTGSELLVWGGLNGVTARSDGARYDPALDTWTALPTPAPAPRLKHMAVWSGEQMIVFGGTDTFDWLQSGGVYDRAADAWISITNLADAPFMRESASAAWTHTNRMLIWSGWDGGNFLADGSVYDPTADSWTAIAPTGPAGRTDHASVWTGSELFVWGGCAGQSCSEIFSDGGRYDPAADAWILINADPGLSARARPSAVWTGSAVIVWGGEASTPLSDGARATLP